MLPAPSARVMSVESPQRPIAVIGAGTMGSGIAQKIAQEGFRVVVVDMADAPLERGRGLITKTLSEAVARKILNQAHADATLGRLTFTTDFERASDAEIVIEAVFEDLEVKRQVFGRLDAVCRPDTILASNTSSLHVRDLAAMTRRPDRVVGLHYFYHPAKNRLVEVVPTAATSKDTVARATALQDAIGKTSIRCADAPGFVVNRFFVPWLNEAVRLLGDGVADVATVEAAARQRFEIGMGPFELMNVTGVPITLHAAAGLAHELGPFYAPDPRLRAQVDSAGPWKIDGAPDTSRFDAVADRLDGAVGLSAASLVAEGVGAVEDADIGARVGLRWPKGPFERMNARGTAAAARLAASVAERWSMDLPADLRARLSSGAPYRFQRIRLEVTDGVADIVVNRPDALNALNPDVVRELGEKVDEAIERSDVRGIVLRGAGKAFVAGADIKFFVDRMAEGDLLAIDAFARAGQRVLDRLDRSPKPVVAVLDGLALGGGSELALAADFIVATDRGSLGFPETGIGIYPGLGGTQRTTRRVGVGLCKWLVLAGATVDARTAAEIGLVDRVVARGDLGGTVRALATGALPPERPVLPPDRVPPKWRALSDFFAGAQADDLLGGKADTGGDPALEKACKPVRFKAPIAVRIAARIIDEGARLPLDAALALESAHAAEVFGSADAREGMAAVLGRRRPTFGGT